MKTHGDSSKYGQDEHGQWWYYYGRQHPTRTRVYARPCDHCGDLFLPGPNISPKNAKRRYCSRTCSVTDAWARPDSNKGRGEKSTRWRDGKVTDRSGYIRLFAPDHPRCQGNQRKYVQEHILVMERMLGRYLESRERVHHKNGIRHDNRPANLELWTVVQPYGVRHDEQQHCPTCTCFT